MNILDATRPLYTSYLRIRSTASNASSPELLQARGDLEQNLQDLTTDLQDLLASVRAAEKDPLRYGLETEEVVRRGRFVQEVTGEIQSMRDELLRQFQSSATDGSLPEPSGFDIDDDDHGAFEQQKQQEIMAEQDEALDDVFRTVGTLRAQADTMGRELEEQGDLLEDVHGITDRVGGKLKGGMRNLNEVIRKNEGMCVSGPRLLTDLATEKGSGYCIAILIFVLIILFILVVAL